MIDNIKDQLKDAMISKDKNRIIALRNFLAKLKAKEIEKKELEIKKQAFEEAGRLRDKEKKLIFETENIEIVKVKEN